MRYALAILQSAGSDRPCSFNDLLRGMGPEAPSQGNRDDWRDFFLAIDRMKELKLIIVDRMAGKIDSVRVTPEGLAMIPRLKRMQPGQASLGFTGDGRRETDTPERSSVTSPRSSR